MADPAYDWTPEYYYAQPANGPSPFQERGLDFETFMQRTAQQNEEGLPVRLEVPKLSWKRIKSWDLLMIYTKPEQGFAHRSNWAKMAKLADEGFRYHISLCFVKEVPEEGWEAYAQRGRLQNPTITRFNLAVLYLGMGNHIWQSISGLFKCWSSGKRFLYLSFFLH